MWTIFHTHTRWSRARGAPFSHHCCTLSSWQPLKSPLSRQRLLSPATRERNCPKWETLSLGKITHIPARPLFKERLLGILKEWISSLWPACRTTSPWWQPASTQACRLTMTERTYKAAALTVRALNITSMLTACQVELLDDLADVPETSVWGSITRIMDICVQGCPVQAGKRMAMLVLQERWLHPNDLLDIENI